MKKTVSLILALLIVMSALASCTQSPKADTSTSSDYADSAWLEARIGEIPKNVEIGTADKLGMDMTDFEEDGYIITTENGETVLCGKTAEGLDRAVRKYAYAVENGTADNLNAVYHEGYRIKHFTVAGNPISDYTVVYEDDGRYTDAPSFAADEIIRLVKKASGDVILKKEISEYSDGHQIRITVSDDEALGYCGFKLRTENGDIFIEGAWDNGCALGVYWLLQNYCGWQDLMFGNSCLLESEHVDIPDGLDIFLDPCFDTLYNICCSPWILSNDRSSEDTKHNYGQINGAKQCSYEPAMHGFIKYSWAGEEYSDMEQPCYSSEEVIDECISNISEYLKTQIDSDKVIGKDIFEIDIGQYDTIFYCNCKECREIMKKENGAFVGPIVRFANRIEEELRVDYPGIVYKIFAYHGTNVPPVTAPNENVSVTFCFDYSCFKHTINGNECNNGIGYFGGILGNRKFGNNDYARWLTDWCKLSDRVIVWYYVLDGNLHGYEMFHKLYDDLTFMRDIGVQGVMYQGDSYSICHRSVDWLTAITNFCWHPDMTEEEYWADVRRIMEKEYGNSDEIMNWLSMQHEAQYSAEECESCWSYYKIFCPKQCDREYFATHFDEMYEALDYAVRYAPSYECEFNVRKLLIPCLWQGCMYSYFSAYDSSDTERLSVLDERYEMLKDCIAVVGKENNWTYEGFRVLSELVSIPSTLEECAWTVFLTDEDEKVDCRTILSDPNIPQREAPEKYR